MLRLLPLLLLAATFPDDYKPSPCAPANVCESYKRSSIVNMGAAALGLTALTETWVDAHWDEIIGSFGPQCQKLASCYAQPNNTFVFCDDVVAKEMIATCDARFAKGTNDHTQCNQLVRVYAAGITHQSRPRWEAAQACTAKAQQTAERKLEVSITPAAIPLDYTGNVFVYALDAETRVPVRASVTIGDDVIFTMLAPEGRATTWYPAPWKPKLVRVGNAQGHRDVAPPQVTVQAKGYTTVIMPIPVTIPKMTAEIAPATLKRGKNTVTITTKDASTGEPVEARVMIGERVLGESNQPLELELKRGQKRDEIWVTSMWDHYSDVVVLPAER